MDGYLSEKEILFFNPGKTGTVFGHAANTFITMRELINIQAHLVQMTKQPVIYIEDRRSEKR